MSWRSNGELPLLPGVLTHRSIFSLCGKLMGHLPICGWLSIATAFVRWCANSVTAGWDYEMGDPPLIQMLSNIFA